MEIVTTARAVRTRLERLRHANCFLPKISTLAEFEQRAVLVPGRVFIDDDTRTLMLGKATDFKGFEKLGISREFFSFIKNSDYIFGFFEELSLERVSLDALDFADTYAEYGEHIAILRELLGRYEEILAKSGFVDKIFIPKMYKLNQTYIEEIGEIELFLDGYLTNFEMALFKEVSRFIPVIIHFETTRFNKKMSHRLKNFGFDLEEGFEYSLDLSTGEIKEKVKVDVDLQNGVQIDIAPFGQRLVQAAYVKKRVYDYICEGFLPEKIAVVLPDEGFKKFLMAFDSERNFNFAMGHDFEQTRAFRLMDALQAYWQEDSLQNRLRLNDFGDEALLLVGRFEKQWREKSDLKLLAALIEEIKKFETDPRVLEILDEELFSFQKLIVALEGNDLRSLMHLFMTRLQKRKIDDVGGGKITVLGVLETRGAEFDCVIVVDFNDGLVPRPSQKDLYLSSSVRKRAGLPTRADREALQKDYYYRMFKKAKKISICYVQNNESMPSRFLDELGLAKELPAQMLGLEGILFDIDKTKTALEVSPLNKPRETIVYSACACNCKQKQGGSNSASFEVPVVANSWQEGFIQRVQFSVKTTYDFTSQPLTATKLKDFLECPRRFYLKYIDGLKPAEPPFEGLKEGQIGQIIHKALALLYVKQDSYTQKEELEAVLAKNLLGLIDPKDLAGRIVAEVWLKKLSAFVKNEIERFGRGYKVGMIEKNLSCQFGPLTLEGRIDRIDFLGDQLEVLDYKSGKIPLYTTKTLSEAKDFQLEFYYLLAKTKGFVREVSYYDLGEGKVIAEPFKEEKLQMLSGILEELCSKKSFDFDKTEEIGQCRFCPYAMICDRVI